MISLPRGQVVVGDAASAQRLALGAG